MCNAAPDSDSRFRIPIPDFHSSGATPMLLSQPSTQSIMWLMSPTQFGRVERAIRPQMGPV
jgi:hypothetical protein